MFLFYLCVLPALTTLVEYKYRHSVLPSLARCFFVTIQVSTVKPRMADVE